MVKRARPPRGFVLVIVAVIAVAAVAAAGAVVLMSGGANQASLRSENGDVALAIAQSGLARAEAHALEVARFNDFDRVLDPNLATGAADAECGAFDSVGEAWDATATITAADRLSLPNWAPQNSVLFGNLRYQMVPMNGGAYLVRYDDNDDDDVVAAGPQSATVPDWSKDSNNNLRDDDGAPECVEGPAAPGVGVNNPFRDRDRTMWVTAIGIFPGTDPNTATQRSVLRKLIVNPRPPANAGLQVGGTLSASPGNPTLEFCSDLAGVEVGGNAGGNATTGGSGAINACGPASVEGATSAISAAACCGSNTFSGQTGVTLPPVTVKAPTDPSWWDWTSECNFYLDPTPVTGGSIFWWDASGVRLAGADMPTGQCNSYAGPLVDPIVGALLTDARSCWIPLILVGAPGFDATEVAGSAWQPSTAANVVASTQVLGFPGSPVGISKPDWSTCPDTPSTTFSWDPPDPNAAGLIPRCTTCNSSTTAITAPAGDITFSTSFGAYPTGSYFYKGNFSEDMGVGDPGNGSIPGPAAAWPMISLFVSGNMDQSGKQFIVGVGSKRGGFPSLVVGGTFDMGPPGGGSFATAGSVFTVGNFSMGPSNPTFQSYGAVVVQASMLLGPGTPTLSIDYPIDLLGLLSPRPDPAALRTSGVSAF